MGVVAEDAVEPHTVEVCLDVVEEVGGGRGSGGVGRDDVAGPVNVETELDRGARITRLR